MEENENAVKRLFLLLVPVSLVAFGCIGVVVALSAVKAKEEMGEEYGWASCDLAEELALRVKGVEFRIDLSGNDIDSLNTITFYHVRSGKGGLELKTLNVTPRNIFSNGTVTVDLRIEKAFSDSSIDEMIALITDNSKDIINRSIKLVETGPATKVFTMEIPSLVGYTQSEGFTKILGKDRDRAFRIKDTLLAGACVMFILSGCVAGVGVYFMVKLFL